MKKITIMISLIFSALMFAQAGLIEEFKMDDPAGTTLNALVNSAGTGQWNVSDRGDYIKTDGVGNLVLTAGDNLYNGGRNWSFKDAGTGKYELTVRFSGVDYSSGSNGSLCGFNLRDASNADIVGISVARFSDKLRLRVKDRDTYNLLKVFDSSATDASIQVRSVVDLDTDTMDVFYSIDGGAEEELSGLPTISGGILDHLTLNFKGDVMGPTDFVKVDYVSVSQIPEPATFSLFSIIGITLIILRKLKI